MRTTGIRWFALGVSFTPGLAFAQMWGRDLVPYLLAVLLLVFMFWAMIVYLVIGEFGARGLVRWILTTVVALAPLAYWLS